MKTFKCLECQGTGKYGDFDQCEHCGGRGVRPISQRFENLGNGAIWDNQEGEHAAHCQCDCQGAVVYVA